MIQVFKPFYRTNEILELVQSCCDIGWTGIGGKMLDFEEAWKEYSGAKTGHMVNSATAGLHLAIMQLKMKYGWKDGDEIITTPLTFISSNHAILYNNLKPVFADIDRYGCLNYKSVESKITSKTRAILFVGLGGNSGKLLHFMYMDKRKDNNIKLILDAAHMSGSKWKDTNRQIGCNDKEIDVVVFSQQAVKNAPSFDSGLICWNGDDAEEMDEQTRKLSWLGISKSTYDRTTSKGNYKWYYDVPYLGYKYHGNAIAGCFGLVALKYLDQDNAYRRRLCDLYTDQLKGKVEIVPTSSDCISSRHLFQILVDKRDEVMLALNQVDIFPGVHYRDNTIYPMYQYAKGTCPRAESFSNRTITLPLHLHMTEKDVMFVCEKLKEIVK